MVKITYSAVKQQFLSAFSRPSQSNSTETFKTLNNKLNITDFKHISLLI